jgi:hypothetical protein
MADHAALIRPTRCGTPRIVISRGRQPALWGGLPEASPLAGFGSDLLFQALRLKSSALGISCNRGRGVLCRQNCLADHSIVSINRKTGAEQFEMALTFRQLADCDQ